MYGNPHLPLTFSEDACVQVFQYFATQNDFSHPLSCPASLSITPVPSYSSSSQETLSQDSTGKGLFLFYVTELSLISSFSVLRLNSCFYCQTALTALKEGLDHRNFMKEFMLMPSNPY